MHVAAPDGFVRNKKRVASGTYAPGSTMHVVVGVAVLFVGYLVLKL